MSTTGLNKAEIKTHSVNKLKSDESRILCFYVTMLLNVKYFYHILPFIPFKKKKNFSEMSKCLMYIYVWYIYNVWYTI